VPVTLLLHSGILIGRDEKRARGDINIYSTPCRGRTQDERKTLNFPFFALCACSHVGAAVPHCALSLLVRRYYETTNYEC
jgi:hypothetical protein